MKRVLFDTNVLVDIGLMREPFFEHSKRAVCTVGQGVIGYINAITLVNVHYLVKKVKGADLAKEFVSDLLSTFEIADLDKSVCMKALLSDFKDFEDGIQNYSAVNSNIEIIVTRNPKDFFNSELKHCTPSEFNDMITK